jgi:hypothetical protein
MQKSWRYVARILRGAKAASPRRYEEQELAVRLRESRRVLRVFGGRKEDPEC